ncbi:hypothetical protein PDIP_01750 [Penicillium digitatum Pd1]|uniref:Uncharacterized protein n=1 Tax=Penicillium digitatum (strain Pd1 / CECT 20795) TaxID=1170230 RepID=K9H4Y6_PEND1|nr:hypothetical protein PDIP_01750 [Penicillium digitatum Pd1]EKV21913.1 hypothetical protein PDIP_01750 [Penicillium digitatum Pd1]
MSRCEPWCLVRGRSRHVISDLFIRTSVLDPVVALRATSCIIACPCLYLSMGI